MNFLHRFIRWLTLRDTVSRREYVVTGWALMILKYTVEAVVIGNAANQVYAPLDFFNPLISARSQFTAVAPPWLGMAWVLWTIPFVWIAVTLSVGRAIDAGRSPWLAMLVLVPIINLPLMLYLAWIPSREPVASVPHQLSMSRPDPAAAGINAALAGIAVGAVYFLLFTLISINAFRSYGSAVFFGTPVIAGAVAAYIFNRPQTRSSGATLVHSLLVVLTFGGFLLVFGLEGAICIAMALPIVVPAAFLGAFVGRAIAKKSEREAADSKRGLVGCLLVLPFMASIEPLLAPQTEFEVLSVVEISAPPEKVWKCVVSFPPITREPEWFFRWGISTPQGARIEGNGVGAMRYCDFTTGSFVEPVTVWDPPRVLAFAVTEQPEPMTELSPYQHIHPPHLDGSFRSTHGEFRLVALANGGTRLEGRTWYKLEIYPHAYWTLWTDWLVHCIHGRVLRHIKLLAEDQHAAG